MIQYRPVTFEVEVYRDESGEWVARAVEYEVSATGRTEKEALARVMEALAAHFKKVAR